jgi:DNA-binding winged helix-turn-helix (wHTH) protein/TolB-like protein/tetratricopeptide (TPR) repeat protein
MSKASYEFGSFRVDAARRTLLCDAQPVTLTPKNMETLLVFLENRGRVLEKDELMNLLWPDSVVEENNLTQNISALRKALGERPNEQRFIKTIPGRGYRFVAEVRVIPDDPAEMIVRQSRISMVVEEEEQDEELRSGEVVNIRKAADAGDAGRLMTASSAQPFSRSLKVLLAVGLLAVLGAGITFWLKTKESSTEQATPRIKSLAVLPFKSLSPHSSEDYLGLGLADVMITRLSNVSTLAVRPTSSVLGFAQRDPLQAGRELQVDSVLDGSIQQVGDRVRVTVRLVRVADGQPLWAYQCDQSCTDVFTLQDTVSTKVTEALALKLTGDERRRLTQRYTGNQAAWEAYARGRYYRNRASTEGFDKALESFQHAIEADPNFALAYAALADAYFWSPRTGASPTPREAERAAQQALALDEELAEAHASLGLMHLAYDWEFPAAEQELMRAIELSPGLADARMWYGRYLALMGRFDESIAELKRAAELDPLSPLIRTEAGLPYFLAGRYDAAVAWNVGMLEIDPNLPQVQVNLAITYAEQGQLAKALTEFERVRQTDAGFKLNIGWLIVYAYAKAGDRAAAERTLRQTLNEAQGRYVYPYDAALAYGAMGEKDQAFEWLEKGYQERVAQMAWLRVDPRFKPLRDDPRFDDLLRRVGLAR